MLSTLASFLLALFRSFLGGISPADASIARERATGAALRAGEEAKVESSANAAVAQAEAASPKSQDELAARLRKGDF